jgi:hypothetical protein
MMEMVLTISIKMVGTPDRKYSAESRNLLRNKHILISLTIMMIGFVEIIKAKLEFKMHKSQNDIIDH